MRAGIVGVPRPCACESRWTGQQNCQGRSGARQSDQKRHEALLADTDGGTYSAAKKVAMSRASSSGSSAATSRPPLGIGVHWRTL
jgi:hypothetical protein